MNEKVLLVDPPFHAFFEYDRWWYSYACTQIAGSLREKGIETYVYDADRYFKKNPKMQSREEMVKRQSWYQEGVKNDNHYVWKHFRETLEKVNPNVIGITTWTSKMQSVKKTLAICKEFNPQIKICVGGYHASAKPQDFKNNPLVDTIFTGPVEHTMLRWIRNNCQEKFIAADPRNINIQKLPAPSRESLLYPKNYTSRDMGMIMTSRGCPFDCTFCSNELLTGRKYQMRTVKQVGKEIEDIIDKYNIKSLFIADANFFGNLKKSLEMSTLFKSFNLPWGAEGRIDFISEGFLEKIIDHGCTNLSFGIETGTNEGMKRLNKGITTEQVYSASKILNKYNMNWKCFFIIGFPNETLEDMEQTRKLALNIGASNISLNSFVPLPGTRIYEQAGDLFVGMSEDIYEYNQLTPKATFLKDITSEQYREKFMSIIKDFDDYNGVKNTTREFH